MSFTVVCAGSASTIKLVESDGTVYSLSPFAHGSSILLGSGRPRAAVFPGGFALVNCPSKALWVDTLRGLVIPMSIPPPTTMPVLTDGASSSFPGGDTWVRISHIVKDENGVLIAESALGPAGTAGITASTAINVAFDTADEEWITGRRFYRSADGETYVHWLDVDDNTTREIEDGTLEESLSTIAAPDYSQAPIQFSQIVEFRGRLWAISPSEPDTLFGTDAGLFYSWPLEFPVRPVQGDAFGVTGLIARRTELGVFKRGVLWRLAGDAPSNFRLERLFGGAGCVSPDSCLVINDVGYWLDFTGVYEWSSEGVKCITDDTVRPWFTTSTYFNRAQFTQAQSAYDPVSNCLVIALCATGSSTLDRWVTFNLGTRQWMGPHTTGLTLTGFATGEDANGAQVLQLAAGDGALYVATPGTYRDSTATAIDTDLTAGHHTTDPDLEHYFGELTVLQKAQAAGTLQVMPSVGTLSAVAGATISHDMTKERQRHRRLGTGNFAKLRFRVNTADVGVELRGYVIDPMHPIGKR